MTEEEVMNEIGRMIDKMIAETIGGPPKVNKLTALRYIGGRFESVEIDDNGLIIEPTSRCWKCGPQSLKTGLGDEKVSGQARPEK